MLNQVGFYLNERGWYTDAEPFTNESADDPGESPWPGSTPPSRAKADSGNDTLIRAWGHAFGHFRAQGS